MSYFWGVYASFQWYPKLIWLSLLASFNFLREQLRINQVCCTYKTFLEWDSRKSKISVMNIWKLCLLGFYQVFLVKFAQFQLSYHIAEALELSWSSLWFLKTRNLQFFKCHTIWPVSVFFICSISFAFCVHKSAFGSYT